MTREFLANKINLRRIVKHREPLTTAHIMRAIRFVLGPEPKRRAPWRGSQWDRMSITPAGVRALDEYETQHPNFRRVR